MMLKQQQLQETLMRDRNQAMMKLVQALQSRQSMPPPQEPLARQQPGLKPEPIPDAINKLLAKETRDFKAKVLAYARVKDQVDKAKQDYEILSTSTGIPSGIRPHKSSVSFSELDQYFSMTTSAELIVTFILPAGIFSIFQPASVFDFFCRQVLEFFLPATFPMLFCRQFVRNFSLKD